MTVTILIAVTGTKAMAPTMIMTNHRILMIIGIEDNQMIATYQNVTTAEKWDISNQIAITSRITLPTIKVETKISKEVPTTNGRASYNNNLFLDRCLIMEHGLHSRSNN